MSSASQKGSAPRQSKCSEQLITQAWDDPGTLQAGVMALLGLYKPRAPYPYKGVAVPMQSQEVGLEGDT